MIERVRAWLARPRRSRKADRPLPAKRRRIALWAIAIGLVAGSIELFLPLEDAYRAVRAMAREHPSDGRTAVVFVDDRSLDELRVSDPDRADDARVLSALFAMGAQRVFFDRAYVDAGANPAGDAAFASTLRQHRERVFIGATSALDRDGAMLYPNPLFRDAAGIVSLEGYEGPFGLSIHYPTSSTIRGQELPALSAKLAEYQTPHGRYAIDLAIDHKSIPQFSYIDVLRRRVPAQSFAGKDVVVAPSSRAQPDVHLIPFNTKVSGALLHVMGAETLRKGYPLDLGFIPALLIVSAFVWYQSRKPRLSKRETAGAFVFLAAAPYLLDQVQVSVDVMPACACLSIAALRLGRLGREAYRGSTSLQKLAVLQRSYPDDQVDVIALKLRNLGTISALSTPEQVNRLLVRAQAMLQATDQAAEFAFDKDTFVWLASRLRQGDLEDHLRGLHALFSTSIAVGEQAPDLASSIGVDTDYAAPLRERTENAMQCAEDAARAGRIFMVAEPRMAADRVWRLQMLSELEAAIRVNAVDVFFQPKISLSDGRMAGAEALMRWHHPRRGMIEPSQVIAIAEEHNRVETITRFVLAVALKQARMALALDPLFKIAVNISALDLQNPLFASHVELLLAQHRFPAANLVLEITETAPIENDDVIASALKDLKALGVHLSVDDFGTGHGSLHYLRRIPADEVKIDRSFVTSMDTSPEDQALVRTAIDMIHSLGRTAVAEGVESQAIVDLLRAMKCDAAQGYHFSKAVPMEDLLASMRSRTIAA